MLSALLALVVAAFVALTLPGTAMATPCGDAVLADWFDNGRIDRLYQAHCYEEAIDDIPDDLRDYANAEEIIGRALQASLRNELAPGGVDPTPDDNPSRPGAPANPGPTPDDNPSRPGAPANPGGPSDPSEPTEPGSEAAPDVDTSGISSVPIPLLVLGGMSVALLGAGGLGYLSRRRAANADDGPHGPDDV